MSVKQYIRKAQLLIGNDENALDVSDLRFKFFVKRGNVQTPNTVHLQIYNPKPSTVSRTLKEFTRVRLSAGYEGNFGLIFDGTIKQTRHMRESPTDTILDITAADGDSAYNFAPICKTLAAGSTFKDHVSAVQAAMATKGVTQGHVSELPATVFPRGKVMFGLARDCMSTTARTLGADWSIEDGRLQVLNQSAYIDGDVPDINYESGMIGLPTQTVMGIEFRTLINPSVKIGHAVHLNNASIQKYQQGLSKNDVTTNLVTETINAALNADGFYKVMRVEHTGDTRGNDWYSYVVGITIDRLVTNPFGKNRAEGPGVAKTF